MDLLGKLLNLFGEWIDWACRLTPILGLKCFGLKHKVSRLAVGRMLKRAKVVLRRARFRVGSSSLGSKSISKKAVLLGSDAVVDSSLVSSSGFGATDGRVLVTRAILGLSSLVAADGPIPSSPGPVPAYSRPKSSMQAFGSDASVVTGSVTLGLASSMAAFGPVPNSSGLVLESSRPKSSMHASLF